MKKLLIGSVLTLVLSLGFAGSAEAAWWNPSTWFQSSVGIDNSSVIPQTSLQITTPIETPAATSTLNDSSLQSEIDVLTAQNTSLQSKLASVEKQLAAAQNNYALCQTNLTKVENQNVQPQAVQQPLASPAIQAAGTAQVQQKTGVPSSSIPGLQSNTQDTPFQYKTYIQAKMSDYVKNPTLYQGWGLGILGGRVSDFIPTGNRGVVNNYVEITDGSNKVMIEIDDPNDYGVITSSLNIGDQITVWGVGIPTQKFNPPSGSTSDNPIYEPVISVQSISKCIKDQCALGDTLYVWDLMKS